MKALCWSDHKNRLETEAALEKITLESLPWDLLNFKSLWYFHSAERKREAEHRGTVKPRQWFHLRFIIQWLSHTQTHTLWFSLTHTHTYANTFSVRKWRLEAALWWQRWLMLWFLEWVFHVTSWHFSSPMPNYYNIYHIRHCLHGSYRILEKTGDNKWLLFRYG